MVERAFAGKFAVVFAAVVLGTCADEMRIRHMADTYLQSDGTQVIDLGILATTNMRYEAVFEPTLTNGTRYLFGSAANQSTSSPMKYGLYVQVGNISLASGTGAGVNWGAGWHGMGKVSYSHYRAVYDCSKRTAELWSGETRIWNTTGLLTPGFETNTCTVTLFCNHQAPTIYGDLFGGKVYSFKVYDKDTLIRDLIPYGRGAVTGMLDRCSGKVYTNVRSGGHPFVLGTDDGYIRSDRTKWAGQWLDTGYCANPQTKIEVDFALQDVTTAGQRIFGADTVDGLGISLYVSGGKKFGWCCCDDPPVWHDTTVPADGTRRKAVIDVPNAKITFSHGGVTEYEGEIDPSACTRAATTSLRLFGGVYTNEYGTVMANCGSSTRIYGVRIWNGETLVRDYKPRIVDNSEGLYDAVNGTFSIADPSAVNNSDSGKYGLTAGGDIECTAPNGTLAANKDAYLESLGGQAIDTGLILTRKTRLELDFSVRFLGGTHYLFGSDKNGFYCQRQTNVRKLSLKYSMSNGTGWPTLNDKVLPVRYREVMDFKNAKSTFTYPDGTISIFNMTGLPSALSETKTVWFMACNGGGYSTMRLYSFAIYEDDVLVHRYTPCVENGIAGVWDDVDKEFHANLRAADGSGFTFHGAGVDGGGMVFTEQPQGGRLSRGHTLALTAFAPGAAGYQWLKNGAIVEGATGRTLEVAYGEGGTTDTYQCVSYYELFGYGTSAEAQVENLPSGTVMTVR